MILDGRQAGHNAHQGHSLGDPQLPSQLPPQRLALKERIQLKAQGDDGNLVQAGHTIVSKLSALTFAHGHDPVR